MNILVLSWRDHRHPQAGGAEQVMWEHIKGWIRAEHNVTLFSSRFVDCQKYEKSEGIEIVHEGDQYIGVKVLAFIYWLRNHRKFDLAVDQFHGIPFFTPLYVRKPKLAILQEVAKEVWFLNGFRFPVNYFIGIIGFVFEPIIFLFYRRIPFMVGSESAKSDLAGVGIPQKNITIIPHGVIVEKPKNLPVKEKTKTIVFLGALTKDKGIEDAIKTFSILNKLGNYSFWLIGKGGKEYVDYLLNLCRREEIDHKTKFWDFVGQKKKFELLARAHILINPSIREGWGLVNIEANSVGTPVVAYSSPGLIDSVKDGESGILVRENSPQKLAAMIIEILEDEERYKHLQAEALSWSKNFSWEKSKRLSLALIENLILSSKNR